MGSCWPNGSTAPCNAATTSLTSWGPPGTRSLEKRQIGCLCCRLPRILPTWSVSIPPADVTQISFERAGAELSWSVCGYSSLCPTFRGLCSSLTPLKPSCRPGATERNRAGGGAFWDPALQSASGPGRRPAQELFECPVSHPWLGQNVPLPSALTMPWAEQKTGIGSFAGLGKCWPPPVAREAERNLLPR